MGLELEEVICISRGGKIVGIRGKQPPFKEKET